MDTNIDTSVSIKQQQDLSDIVGYFELLIEIDRGQKEPKKEQICSNFIS